MGCEFLGFFVGGGVLGVVGYKVVYMGLRGGRVYEGFREVQFRG